MIPLPLTSYIIISTIGVRQETPCTTILFARLVLVGKGGVLACRDLLLVAFATELGADCFLVPGGDSLPETHSHPHTQIGLHP